MDVSKLYGYNKTKADVDGVWIECGEDGAVLCRYYSAQSPRVAAIHAKRTKKYRALINARALPPDKDRLLAVEIFTEAAVMDWRGIQQDGKDIPFSFDAAVKLFMDVPEFYTDIAAQATDLKTFRDEDDLKN